MTITRKGFQDPRADYGDFVNGSYATDAPSINADLFNNISSILVDTIGKLAPRAQDTPDMTIAVSAGVAYINGALVSYAGGNTGAASAPSANPRIDRVSLLSNGTLSVTSGEEGESPTAPALVANTFPICLVYHRVGSVHIDDADDSSNSYIYRDDRAIFQSVATIDGYLDTIGNTQHSIVIRGASDWDELNVTEQTVVGRITGGNLAALTVAQLATLALSAALPENTAIILDPSLSADGKYSGIVETGTAGATLAFGDVIYQAVADDRWELAKADAAATSTMRLGICVQAAASDGNATTILLYGKVRADTAFPTFTKYAPVYISSGTAGDLTSTCPSQSTGHIVRVVGHAISGDELHFAPDCTWIEYA